MFNCQSCFRQCLRALISTHPPPVLGLTPSVPASAIRRNHFAATPPRRQQVAQDVDDFVVEDASVDERSDNSQPQPPPADWKSSGGARKRKNDEKKVLSRREKAPVPTRLKEQYLLTELKYLKDPVKLADHVKYVLDRNDEEKAVALVRLSSKSLANTVSWNHLINWLMKKGQTSKALNTYNEMKKRGQQPDSHTILLLMRGLAAFAHHPNSLTRALSLYHAASRLPGGANIKHTNAVVNVCARANDMDSLWDIVSKMPEKGPHAPDHITFTTILGQMRHSAITGVPEGGETAEESAMRRDYIVTEGRKLWTMIVARWRAGDMLIDRDLVDVMGRLLLVGSRPQDWDDVLSLVEQTMNIPRQVARVGSDERAQSDEKPIRAPNIPPGIKRGSADEPSDPMDGPRPGSEFDVVPPVTPPRSPPSVAPSTIPKHRRGARVQPGTNTLSLVLEACLKTVVSLETSIAYWDRLTDPAGAAIHPDLDNAHMLMRNMRQARASSALVDFLRTSLPSWQLKPTRKTFRLAMSGCLRDAQGSFVAARRAFDAASRVLDAMQAALADHDARAVALYLDAALRSRDVRCMLRALDRLQPSVVNLRSLLAFGRVVPEPHQQSSTAANPPSTSKPPTATASAGTIGAEERADAVLLLRRLISLYDRALDSQILGGPSAANFGARADLEGYRPTDDEVQTKRRLFVERRAKLGAFVSREAKKAAPDVDWDSVRSRRRAMREKKGRKAVAVAEEGEEDEEEEEAGFDEGEDYAPVARE